MTKIQRNSNKSRARRNKIKARVRNLRARTKSNKLSTPYYTRASESERLEIRKKLEAFVKASGKALNANSEAIEREIVYTRWNMLFNPSLGFKTPTNS
jgi:hypothetical protein